MKKIKATKDMLLREIVGEYVLVPVGEMSLKIHGIISISESAQFLWERIVTGTTEKELVDCLLEEYQVDYNVALNDVKEFVSKMERLGIVEVEGDYEK